VPHARTPPAPPHPLLAVHPEHPGEPDSLVYRLDLPDRPYAVALIAGAGASGVTTLTLRRDIRLPG